MTFQGNKKIRNYKNVHNFWEKEGRERGSGIFATLRDHYFRYVEILEIIKNLGNNKKNKILDIGCGNGISTFYFSPYAKKITAIDYSKNLIKNAKKFQNKKNFSNLIKKCDYQNLKSGYKNINFKYGNILDLTEYEDNFNAVICSRVLINLDTVEKQNLAMKNIYNSMKKNSILIINEVEKNFHKNLSKLRVSAKLEPLEIYWHNLYLNETQFLKNAKKIGFKLKKKLEYGEYQGLTKVVYPKLIHPKPPSFLSDFNKLSTKLFIKDRKIAHKIVENFLGKKINHLKKCSHQTGYVFIKQ